MILDKFIIELQKLQSQGYGQTHVTIFEAGLFDKVYLTTVENIEVRKESKDFSEKDAIVLLR